MTGKSSDIKFVDFSRAHDHTIKLENLQFRRPMQFN